MVRNNPSACYMLISNIEFTDADFSATGDFYNEGKGWIPIGYAEEIPISQNFNENNETNLFSGTFDGNGKTIKGLQINTDSVYVGLFGYSKGTIKNLGMIASKLTFYYSSDGGCFVGEIAGYNIGTKMTGYSNTGEISNCYNIGSLRGSIINLSDGGDNDICEKGIAGVNTGGTISNCYYVNTCINDIDSGSGDMYRRTSAQMKLQETFVGFDFADIWTMEGDELYPYPELRAVPMIHEGKVSSILMYRNPDKLTYDLSEYSLVLAGGIITVNYEDGLTTNIDITDEMVSGFNNKNPGDKTITVTYEGKTTTFKVTVTPPDYYEAYIVRDENRIFYETLAEAIIAVENNEEIILRKTSTGEGTIVNKAVRFIINSNDYLYNAPISGTGFIFETVVNGNKTTYTFAQDKSSVSVQSRVIGTNNSIANVLGGGIDITYAKGTTITAPTIAGYLFLGWYENYSAANTGFQLTTENTYFYKPVKDVILTAVYKVNENATVTLKVSAPRFKVTGTDAVQTGGFVSTYCVGDSITVEFKDNNSDFLYWANDSNKIVSKEAKYTFIIGANTCIQAFSGDKEAGAQAFVVFVSAQNQIMNAQAYTRADSITFPIVPARYGCIFDKWVFEDGTTATEAAIKERMADNTIIKVIPEYEADGNKYTVTVNYEGVTKESDKYKDNTPEQECTITADVTIIESEVTKYFLYWRDESGQVITYNPTYRIYSSKNITITAVYGDSPVMRQACVSVREIFAEQIGGKYQTSFVEYYDIPDDCRLYRTGFLVTLNYYKATKENLVVDGEGINQFESNLTEKSGTYITNIVVGEPDTVIYARAFIQYLDAEGRVKTVYSEIVGKKYDDLK